MHCSITQPAADDDADRGVGGAAATSAGSRDPDRHDHQRQWSWLVAAGDIISFDLPDHSTITLASELLVAKNLTISGPGAAYLAISGDNAVRVLQVWS